MDPQLLPPILAHESVTMTPDEYAELDDVKREFAGFDLCQRASRHFDGSATEPIDTPRRLP
jgi:hypothetical protein